MIRVQVDMLVHADKPEYAKRPTNLYRTGCYKNQRFCKKFVIPQHNKQCHHHHAHRCCSGQRRWRAGIPFYVLFFDLVICTAIPPQKMAFRSSIHISNMFSPPAVSLVCLGDRLVKQRIGIPHGYQLIHPALTKRCRKQRLCTPWAIMNHDMRMPIPARDAVFMKLRQI